MKKLALLLAISTQAAAAQLTVNELFVMSQKYPLLAEAYVAGVLDASKDQYWCDPRDPDPKLVLRAALSYALQNNVDPKKPADFAIVPLLNQLAPCNQDKNT